MGVTSCGRRTGDTGFVDGCEFQKYGIALSGPSVALLCFEVLVAAAGERTRNYLHRVSTTL